MWHFETNLWGFFGSEKMQGPFLVVPAAHRKLNILLERNHCSLVIGEECFLEFLASQI